MKVSVEQYVARRREREANVKPRRQLCGRCRQPNFNCLCAYLESFDPKVKFVILIHSIEAKRRVATGRLAHLCLENSELITGHDYSRHKRVNELIADQQFSPMLLYPGADSQNLSAMTETEKSTLITQGKRPLIFVVDGTWNTAKKMVRLSENLRSLPRICFVPPAPSAFKVRKQPRPDCFSTIEAIHHALELLASNLGLSLAERRHDLLTQAFQKMVEQQLEYVKKSVVRHVRYKPVA